MVIISNHEILLCAGYSHAAVETLESEELRNRAKQEAQERERQERWHRMVTVALCSGGIILGLLNMHMIFLKRRNKLKEAEIEQLRQFHDLNKTK